jgi:hypothetical protein
MLFGASGYPTPVFYGFVPVEGEVRAIVWIEANPRRSEERQRVRDFAAQRLDESWTRPADLWQLVWKSERAVNLDSEDAATAWFLERIEELRRAGFFEFIETLRPTTIEPEEQEAPDEVLRATALDPAADQS